MPEVRNCRRCKRLFTYVGGAPICQDCQKADEESFKKVKEYIYDNPGITLSEVSAALDISIERIKGYLREGRLEIVGSETNLFLDCEKCGKAIKSGRYCDACSADMTNILKTVAKGISEDIKKQNQHDDAIKYRNKETHKR